MLKGKQIVVGVCGGIAAYKAAELVRLLVRREAQVRVAMTRAGTRFVSPVTFQALSGNPVLWDMFSQEGPSIEHVTWGQEADLVVIAPATADFIGKMAHGIGDDFLSSMILAATAPVLLCPSMNVRMYENAAVRENLKLVRSRGVEVMTPEEGALACGAEGPGRLPEPDRIVEHAEMMIFPKDLAGWKILVTAGPTYEPIDPVRFVGNRSSGKMGYALARVARRRGAQVTLVSGPGSLQVPLGVVFRPVTTAEEMKRAVFENCEGLDMIIKAAAVSDYRPDRASTGKIKKGPSTTTLRLVKNPDILEELGCAEDGASRVLVGFSAETEDLLAHARAKLEKKNLDMIVANDVSRSDAGFAVDDNEVKLIFRDGTVEEIPMTTKERVADLILTRGKELREKRGPKR